VSEVADLDSHRAVLDSKKPTGAALKFTAAEVGRVHRRGEKRTVRLTAKAGDQRHGLRKPNTRPVPLVTRPLTRQPSVRYIECW
jgi:hypothetical protein